MHKEQVEYFVLVYRIRNFSAAAKMVPMSPQGLTKSIHSLEKELGVTLFTDINGALTPTPYADEFIRHATNWKLDYQVMQESFRRIKARERHEIHLGTSLGIIGFLGTEFIERFHKEYPQITILYNESNDRFCEEGLEKGTYDFALTLAPYGKNFITAELYATQVYFWVNARNMKRLGKSIALDELEGRNIGIPGKDFKIFETITAACKSNGIILGDIFASNEIFWLYEYTAQGKGISFTLPHLINLSVFSNNDDVVALPLEGIPWKFGVSYLYSHALAPHEEVFLEYCVDYAKSLP